MNRSFSGTQNRPGFAMFIALGALVIIGVLVAASSFITLQEGRLGQNQLAESRSFSAAEYGLNKIQADWDKTPNLQMAVGTSYDTSYALNSKDTAKVRYTRLNNETFWIVSEGRSFVGSIQYPNRTAVKRVGAILRLRIPTIKANGAVTGAGKVLIQGSAEVRGANSLPANWAGCDASAPGKAAVVVSGADSVTIQKPGSVTGTPQITVDPLAADSNTYVRYGDETWTALVQQANVILTNENGPDAAPDTFPVPGGACNKGLATNWGEPWRPNVSGIVPACYNYFPIIYSTGNLKLNKGRGQGILLVNGDLRANGQFEWYGLIVIRDDFKKGNGSAKIFGAIMARNAEPDDAVSNEVIGNITVNYSQCSLEHAMRGSAQVVQAKERAWAELF
jgi:hypothetical protein